MQNDGESANTKRDPSGAFVQGVGISNRRLISTVWTLVTPNDVGSNAMPIWNAGDCGEQFGWV